jgi:hypothetical protein
MRQLKTILDQTPEGFDAQVNAAMEAVGRRAPPGDPHPGEYPDSARPPPWRLHRHPHL